MSKQANKTLIGGFLVGAVVLIVAGVLIFGSGRFLSERVTFVMYFDGSVKGLDVGAPVVFRGVKVGSVTNIRLDANPDDLSIQIPVFIEIEPDRVTKPERAGRKGSPVETVKILVGRGLRAKLQMKSIVTGQMMIELDFHPDKPLKFVSDGTVPEIPTIPSGVEEWAKKIEKIPVEQILEKLLSAIEGIDKAINAPEMQKMSGSLNQTLEEVRKLVRNIDEEVAPLSSNIEKTLKEYGKLARNVDGKVQVMSASIEKILQEYGKLARKAQALAAGIEDTGKDTQKLVRNVDAWAEQLAASVKKTAEAATETLVQARKTLSTVKSVASEDSEMAYELTNTLRELASAAHSIRVLADYFERHPETLLHGKGEEGGK